MKAWTKEEIEIDDGTKVLAQMPVIVSASRSTDMKGCKHLFVLMVKEAEA